MPDLIIVDFYEYSCTASHPHFYSWQLLMHGLLPFYCNFNSSHLRVGTLHYNEKNNLVTFYEHRRLTNLSKIQAFHFQQVSTFWCLLGNEKANESS